MSKPEELSVEELFRLPREETEVWVQRAVRQKVETSLHFPIGEPKKIKPGTKRLIAIGGGTLLDGAKAWRADRSPDTELIAVPSIWGSGAEASPIVVENVTGKKVVRIGDQFLPDHVVYWHELAECIPEDLVRTACGDCWSHALEGLLSPLADDSLRNELSDLVSRMLDSGLGNRPVWFQHSADACAGQARSSVGLVHGIAHTLEGPLKAQSANRNWGHAALCATFLWPVMVFNCEAGGKANRILEKHGVNVRRTLDVARALHDAAAYHEALPQLVGNWRSILRDPCTRTNVRLVRPTDFEFFNHWSPS